MPRKGLEKAFIVSLVALLGLFILPGNGTPAIVEASAPINAPFLPLEKAKEGRVSEFQGLFASWSSPSEDQNPAWSQDPSSSGNYIYLTFDDGPDPKWTPQIVELLSRHNATATFFVIGRNAVTYPELLLQEAQAGQMIANHGYNHHDLTQYGYNDFLLEVLDTRDAVFSALSGHPELQQQVVPCLRPPYGAVNANVWTFAYRIPYDISMWTLDTNDWQSIPAEYILEDVLENAEPGSVVLMHDGGNDRSETVEALGLILHELTLRGWQFLPMCTADGQQAPSW